MKITSDIIHDFFRFIYERQLIFYRRIILKQPAPWTDDIVLQKYKIINMYRELDRCTIYLMRSIINLKDRKSQLFNVIFFRFFNSDQIYENLDIKPFENYNARIALKTKVAFSNLKQRGVILFNPAYIISPGNSKQPKHITILDNLIKVWKNLDKIISRIDKCKTPKESFLILCELPLVGPFLACELWTDLVYLNFFNQKWTDDDFVNIGPGAQWGLRILFGPLAKYEYDTKLRYLHKIQKEKLPKINNKKNNEYLWEKIAYEDAYSNYPFLSLTNIEGALCEFRKYWNISHGKGRRRYFMKLIKDKK